MNTPSKLIVALALVSTLGSVPWSSNEDPPETIWVHASDGKDSYAGTERRPLRTPAAALALLPEPLLRDVTIELVGEFEGTGGRDEAILELAHRMRPGVEVRFVGRRDANDEVPVFGWRRGRSMVDAREGTWRIENVRIGTGSKEQRRGVAVEGPAHVTLKDVTFRLRSHSDAGIRADRGGLVSLRGTIRLNEDLHDEAPEESFCGIVATDHGQIRFVERSGATLDLGNGSLSASYYGCIRLGCETARITSWGRQSNNLAVNNGGRIDLHETTTTLRAHVAENTPIGPEHDGHILAEDAHIRIEGKNDCAITLQKASTFTCKDIELAGEFRKSLWAMSASTFVGAFLTDVNQLEAHTGAGVHIEAIEGEVRGPLLVTSGGVISLPDRVVSAME